jgi:hypothetical protein
MRIEERLVNFAEVILQSAGKARSKSLDSRVSTNQTYRPVGFAGATDNLADTRTQIRSIEQNLLLRLRLKDTCRVVTLKQVVGG